MTLAQKMDGFKSKFESGGPPYNAPKAVIDVFHRATEDLRQSGLAERALKTGERAPAFTLNNQDGNSVSSAELLAKGPLVITFFRGHW
jgi:AhpC/TSA family